MARESKPPVKLQIHKLKLTPVVITSKLVKPGARLSGNRVAQSASPLVLSDR